MLLAVSLVLLLVTAAVADEPAGALEAAFGSLLSSLLGVLEPVWQISFDVLQLWLVVLLVLAVVRRHWGLACDVVAVVATVAIAGAAIGRLATVGAVQDIGIEAIVDAVQSASVPLLLFALVIGQTPRLANAAALAAAAPLRIPFGRLTTLQYAITFVNLAMPSTAARVAVNIRFFQRSGLDRTSAITIGALDSIAGFVAQIGLILTILTFGLGSLDLQLDEKFSYEASGDLLLVIAIVLAVAIATALLVPRLRHAVTSWIQHSWTKVWPLLDSPRRLVSVLGANVVVELLFSLCSYTVLRSFAQDVAFADVILVNVGVARFAGLIPVPGGTGVTEAALTAGYVAIGVDSATAVAAAIVYRLITFYLPPLIGYRTMRSLQRQRLL